MDVVGVEQRRRRGRRGVALPAHGEDGVMRAQIGRRVAMAVEAPAHIHAVHLLHQRHPVDAAVTALAGDALRDMDAVVEIGVIRDVVDAVPHQRRLVGEALAHRRQHRCVGPDLRMAAHAGIAARHAGIGGGLDRLVAVAAIEAEPADMMLMAERHRLVLDEADARPVIEGRQRKGDANGAKPGQDQDDERKSRQEIGAGGEQHSPHAPFMPDSPTACRRA